MNLRRTEFHLREMEREKVLYYKKLRHTDVKIKEKVTWTGKNCLFLHDQARREITVVRVVIVKSQNKQTGSNHFSNPANTDYLGHNIQVL